MIKPFRYINRVSKESHYSYYGNAQEKPSKPGSIPVSGFIMTKEEPCSFPSGGLGVQQRCFSSDCLDLYKAGCIVWYSQAAEASRNARCCFRLFILLHRIPLFTIILMPMRFQPFFAKTDAAAWFPPAYHHWSIPELPPCHVSWRRQTHCLIISTGTNQGQLLFFKRTWIRRRSSHRPSVCGNKQGNCAPADSKGHRIMAPFALPVISPL